MYVCQGNLAVAAVKIALGKEGFCAFMSLPEFGDDVVLEMISARVARRDVTSIIQVTLAVDR